MESQNLSQSRKDEIINWLKDPAAELALSKYPATNASERNYIQGCIDGIEQGLVRALAEQGIPRHRAPERVTILLANLQRRERYLRK